MTTLYGIKNCDTVRKARRWLDGRRVAYTFHDLRGEGLDAATLQRWIAARGVDDLLNRRSRSWRDLPAARRDGLDAAGAEQLLLENPTLLRRPVLEDGDAIEIGFDATTYGRRFGGT